MKVVGANGLCNRTASSSVAALREAQPPHRRAYAAWTKQSAEVNFIRVRLQECCYKPDGGSLGSGADEGRAKPRYYPG